MHVVILPSWYPETNDDINGVFFREQAVALKNAGCNVGVLALTVFSLKKIWAWKFFFSKTEFKEESGINTYRKRILNFFPKAPSLKVWMYRRLGLKLFKKYVKAHGIPDVVHVHSMLYAGIIAIAIYDKYGIPYIVTEHSTAYARGLVRGKNLSYSKEIAAKASTRIAVSTPFSRTLEATLAVDDLSWDVIPNIVKQSFFNNSVLKEDKNGKFTFLCVCYLEPKKKVDLLIQAFSIAFGGCENVELRLGGDGSERVALENISKKLNVEKQVRFLGMLSRDAVADEMHNCDVFVLSSQFETFGVVVVEALARGRPVVVTRCGGPEDIVRKQDGLMVSTGSVLALSSAMERMYETVDVYSPEEIRSSCEQRFGEKAVITKIKDVYQEVVLRKNKLQNHYE